MIHDGDRPLASGVLYHRVIDALELGTGVVPVMSPTDAVIQENHEGRSVGYLPRNQILLAQTPQAFITKEYRGARERMQSRNDQRADDGSVFVAEGGNLLTVPGERSNVKVTFPSDVSIVEFYLDAMRDE
jgi:2-C-methyl-D-erythritol 4-phosphate cytidylyltransferase